MYLSLCWKSLWKLHDSRQKPGTHCVQIICQQIKKGRLGFIKDDWDGKNTAELDGLHMFLCVCVENVSVHLLTELLKLTNTTNIFFTLFGKRSS